jgi:hypothetical protein
MTDHAEDGRWDRADATRPNKAVDADGADGVDHGASDAADDDNSAVESYETDDGTVFYESKNPLAWVQSSVTVALQDSA